ncbi:MAG: hypothetical protein UR54_C0009G0037 [Candidatus Roizmanbacteria bacterium GW2011_GWA2_34_18]|uniref:Uncharacterized protein n=1 Tax=Candidatus Roizmanbacteria bacterium GW2011_GWA2_34_18 TaxID=1618477 RepID=A0A0G0E023_9BACT|nr:MAG: hypothetical protein UR54_C0009G0037 [Candidatus Roizmanbacteria bacterium GW2011_GWA2_34_18]
MLGAKETGIKYNMDKNHIRLLEDIKKLLILQLLANGVSDRSIAQILGIDSSTIRHLVSIKKIKNSKKNEKI